MHLYWPLFFTGVFSSSESDTGFTHSGVETIKSSDGTTNFKKLLPVLQQIEFIIKRNTHDEAQIVKDNFVDLIKALNEIQVRTGEKLGTGMSEYKTQLNRLAVENIRKLTKEFVNGVEKCIVQGIDDYNEASASAVTIAQSSYSKALAILTVKPETVIHSEVLLPTSVFNTTVSSIINGVSEAHAIAFKQVSGNTLKAVISLIQQLKIEIAETMKLEMDEKMTMMLTQNKKITNENEGMTELAISESRDSLIGDLEKNSNKLSGTAKFLFEIVRMEMVGENQKNNSIDQQPVKLPAQGMETEYGNSPMMFSGIGMDSILN